MQMLKSLYKRWWLGRLKRQGLQIADDCRLIGFPSFGSEPYLISIGKHVTISNQVSFITHDGGTWVFRDQPRYKDVIKFGRIVIHDNCFVGWGAILMPGITIGPNSVVAAGAVVNKTIPPGVVAGGVPAKAIMTVEEYAAKSLANNSAYDRNAYKSNKKLEITRLFPRPW